MNGWMDECISSNQAGSWIYEWMDGWKSGKQAGFDGYMNGQMSGNKAGLDGQMDGWPVQNIKHIKLIHLSKKTYSNQPKDPRLDRR